MAVPKLTSPEYTAVIEWPGDEFVARLEVANVQTPGPAAVPIPRSVAPSKKVTVPVGVPAPGDTGFTVAINVTDWPYTLGLGEATTVVRLPA